ncbi:frizzled-8 [Numida meleagris]|uniref:frizzled-8 n=1 Tax=Numida meleagris TaxID=8996 RepID=UPI000B3E1BE1|nr:frizzled-8 [Numida meleagris]
MEWSYLLAVTPLLAALALLQRAGCAAASAAAAASSSSSSSSSAKELSCQEITVPLCKGIGYNYTYMPNQFNHDTQDEAGLEVHQFWPLVEIQCSSDLRFFLCSMYTPICLEDYKKPLPPCRSVCERAKAGCAPLMRQYGFAWPDRMRCDRLPEQGSPDTLCMDYNRTDLTTAAPPPAKPPLRGARPGGPARAPPPAAAAPPAEAPRPPPPCEPGCQCRAPMVSVSSERHPLYNRVKTGQIANCALPCHNPYFSPDERAFTAFWIGLWSVLCFLSTFATVSTFLIDMERFKYPERPIIFLAACYLFVSLGYLVRLVAGHEKFTVLYTVPAASVVACLFYEQHNRPRWEATHNCPCLRDQQPDQARRPDYAVFMLKYFMCLVVGITSGVWVWSGKTLESWRALCTRCCWASKGAAVAGGTGAGAGGQAAIAAAGGLGAGGGGSLYSDVSTGLTWRSGTASSVSYPKQMPLSQV